VVLEVQGEVLRVQDVVQQHLAVAVRGVGQVVRLPEVAVLDVRQGRVAVGVETVATRRIVAVVTKVDRKMILVQSLITKTKREPLNCMKKRACWKCIPMVMAS